MNSTNRTEYAMNWATPESTSCSIALTSLDSRDITSPSWRRSKKASDIRWRWANRSVRISSTNRSPTQLHR